MGKGKGTDFEREIARELSLWWEQETDDPRDDIFYRTHASGTRHTARRKKNKTTANFAGDLMYTDDAGKPFIETTLVELKRGYTSMGRITEKTIEKAVEKAKKSGSIIKEVRNEVAKIKRGNDTIDPLDFIDSPKCPPLLSWWLKAEKERKEVGRRFSMIIFKRDGKSKCIMIDIDHYNGIVNHIYSDCFTKCLQVDYSMTEQGANSFLILSYDEFINSVHPDFYARVYEEMLEGE